MKVFGIVMAVILALILMMGGTMVAMYNRFPTHQVKVDEAWAKVQVAYKKRAELVPRVAQVAEKYMDNESKIIIEHARARAGLGSTTLPADATPEQIKAYGEAQAAIGALSSKFIALGRESTPNLKADAQFMQLQRQLAMAETQIQAARNVYIREVSGYNINVTRFPSNLVAKWAGFEKKPQLTFDDADVIKNAPDLFKK